MSDNEFTRQRPLEKPEIHFQLDEFKNIKFKYYADTIEFTPEEMWELIKSFKKNEE